MTREPIVIPDSPGSPDPSPTASPGGYSQVSPAYSPAPSSPGSPLLPAPFRPAPPPPAVALSRAPSRPLSCPWDLSGDLWRPGMRVLSYGPSWERPPLPCTSTRGSRRTGPNIILLSPAGPQRWRSKFMGENAHFQVNRCKNCFPYDYKTCQILLKKIMFFKIFSDQVSQLPEEQGML